MLASPIIPGKAYRVKHKGKTLDVLASSGAAAIQAVLNFFAGFDDASDIPADDEKKKKKKKGDSE